MLRMLSHSGDGGAPHTDVGVGVGKGRVGLRPSGLRVTVPLGRSWSRRGGFERPGFRGAG